MLCHSADHGGVCGCVRTSEVVLCTLTPSPCLQGIMVLLMVSWPWLCASSSSQAEGTAPVSTWLSGRSRCRRWWGPQLGVQTLKCSRVMVVIAAFVLPSGKKAVMQGREGHPFVLTHWQDSGSGSPDAVLFPRRALNPCREVIPSFPVRITLTVPN